MRIVHKVASAASWAVDAGMGTLESTQFALPRTLTGNAQLQYTCDLEARTGLPFD